MFEAKQRIEARIPKVKSGNDDDDEAKNNELSEGIGGPSVCVDRAVAFFVSFGDVPCNFSSCLYMCLYHVMVKRKAWVTSTACPFFVIS